jgi:hypothetical protein
MKKTVMAAATAQPGDQMRKRANGLGHLNQEFCLSLDLTFFI